MLDWRKEGDTLELPGWELSHLFRGRFRGCVWSCSNSEPMLWGIRDLNLQSLAERMNQQTSAAPARKSQILWGWAFWSIHKNFSATNLSVQSRRGQSLRQTFCRLYRCRRNLF